MRTNFYEMNNTLKALIEGVEYDITNYANASALLWQYLEDINWVGFYLMRNGQLELGPFQGKVACPQIEVGKGVCGTAVLQNKTQLVKNVHEFPGHIACDSASNSEIVIPLRRHGEVIGVLDIDSPLLARFTEEDAIALEEFAGILESSFQLIK